jgi:DNA-binding transcriptional LysR family regulator
VRLRPDVSADDLRYLLAVARAGRMVTAAAMLGVEHTTVRRRIDRLETALGVRLLDRSADGWSLTAIGRQVVDRASGVEDVVQAVIAAASGRPGDGDHVRGTVRILAPDAFGALFVAPALARLQRRHPELEVELVTATRPLTLRGSGFDLAVTIGQVRNPRLTSELLTPYSLGLYAAPSYLESTPPIRSLDDLSAHPIVFYVDALLTVPELDLRELLGTVDVEFGATSPFAQLEATRAGAGVGLLHAFMADRDPRLVRVLHHDVDLRLQLSLSMRRDSPAVEVVALVRKALHEEVDRRGDELLPG